ncbi:MAG: HEAT repeat domain-containing protein, partial [Chloroflexota bacterium]
LCLTFILVVGRCRVTRFLLDQDELELRLTAANILGSIKDPSSIEPLLRALQDTRLLRLKGPAAQALAKMNVVEAIPLIEKALKETQGWEGWSIGLRQQLLSALTQLGDEGVRAIVRWIDFRQPTQSMELASEALKTVPVELRNSLIQEAIQNAQENPQRQILNIVLQRIRS